MAHKHSVYDTDLHFLIDPITRVITNQAKQKTTVIQFDHNSERFTFEIPRLVDGHDMSLCTKIEIHYLNVAADKSGLNASVYIADDMQLSPESDDVVIFSWLISHNATAYAGSLNFLIRFLCETGDVVDYLWNTSVCQNITVTPGMNNSESTMEDYSDVLQAWENELNAKLIDRLEQTVESTEGGGVNVWTMTFGNGKKSELRVRNGKDEVYVGTEEPDDPDVLVWVNPDGNPGGGGGGGGDGFSPIVEVEAIENGHRVKITDAEGTETFDVMNGEKGEDGKDGENGADGYSPQKGVDYYTEEEKTELIDEIIPLVNEREKIELIASVTVSPDTDGTLPRSVVISKDADGNEFSLSEFRLVCKIGSSGDNTKITVTTPSWVFNGISFTFSNTLRNWFVTYVSFGKLGGLAYAPSDSMGSAFPSPNITSIKVQPFPSRTRHSKITISVPSGYTFIDGSTFELWGVRV